MKPSDLPAVDPASGWHSVYGAACAPYRRVPGFARSIDAQWAWHWARGKLARDPVFRGLLERRDLRPEARVVDIGCGQGLVAALLHACQQVAERGGWPAHWPAAPSAAAYTGIDLRERDVRRATAALTGLPFAPRFVCTDMRRAALPACDLVVILDVLHYVDPAAQLGVLQRVRQALQPQGRLLLRVGDTAHTRGFAVSQWVDRAVTAVRGQRMPSNWGRPLAEWRTLLAELGFTVHSVPMSQGTPFANVLLVADLIPPLK